VPPPTKAVPAKAVDEEEVTIRKKKKKGKERTITGGDEASVRKKKKSGTATPDVKKHSDALTPDEAAELERVGIFTIIPSTLMHNSFVQRRLERLERQRDDPYYLTDDRPRSTSRIDVDSIPIVRFDMPLLSPGQLYPNELSDVMLTKS
jgi:AP-3 complex subunit delta-1